MAIPLAYNIRSLAVRKTTTLMTALGIALTVSVLVAVLALVAGLNDAFTVSGDPRTVLVMRKGATAELTGGMTREVFADLRSLPGIAPGVDGQPLASLEFYTVINLPSSDSPDAGANIALRGLTRTGLELRQSQVRLAEGQWFRSGQREVVVGKSVASRYPAAALGKKLHFGKGDWTVVGVMDAGRGTANSEIFVDLNQASSDFNRPDALSSVHLRATDTVAAEALVHAIGDDRRLNAQAETEASYQAAQTASGAPVQFLGIFVAIIMAVGSSFAAMNTMYAAVARRTKEVGTLRVLGFSRGSILTSFFIESIVLSLLGGLLGCLLVLPLNGITTGILSGTSFTEVAFNFRTGPREMAIGVAFALLMGAVGGLFPARNAARKEILTALRES